MSTNEVTAIAYTGTLEKIPPTASPGLLFMKALISRTDSLTNTEGSEDLLAPNAVLVLNAQPPQLAHQKDENGQTQQARKRNKRNAALQDIRREFRRAWDIDNGNGTRTVIFESRNIFVFAADPANPVIMPEASTIELEPIPLNGEGSSAFGVAGFWATELRSWHDRVGMLKKREELGC